MSALTFPRLVAGGIAACLAAGLGHQLYATFRTRQHHQGFEHHTLRCESGNIITYYRRPGEAGSPTLVCEAGLLSTSMIWRLVADHLPPTISVVLYDRAGYRNSLRRCQEDYCLRESVDDLVEVIEAGSDPATPTVLTGHSLGGYLVHRAAARVPERVRGVVLIDPTHPRELLHSRAQREGARSANLTMKLASWSVLFGADLLMDKKNILASAEGSPYYRALRLEASTFSVWHSGLREWNYSYPFMLDGGQPLDRLSVPVTVLAAESTMRDIPAHKDLYEEYVASGVSGQIITIPDSNHQSIISGVNCAGVTAQAIATEVAKAVTHDSDPAQLEEAA